MPQRTPVGFVWDLDKAEINLEKHGIAFEDAIRVFDDVTLDIPDIRMGELRIVSVGVVEGFEIAVVYTVRGNEYRIISARRARKREREAYHQVCP